VHTALLAFSQVALALVGVRAAAITDYRIEVAGTATGVFVVFSVNETVRTTFTP
jgi:hypothetical protein